MRHPYRSESLISADHVDIDRIDTRSANTFFVVDNYLLDQPKGRDGLWPIAPIACVAAETPIRHPENSLALAFRRPLHPAEIAQLCDRARFFVRHFIRPAEIRHDINQRIVELNVDDIFHAPDEPIELLGFHTITVAADGTRSVETSPA